MGVLGSPVAADEARWLAPVDAPVVDGFRPPEGPYGAGNRGLEYAAAPGTDVHAVDDGRVVFAGPVGNDLFIVIDHGDGLRSTLGFVEEIGVVRGQAVTMGQVVGRTGPGLHLTARLHGRYLDPALLIAGVELGVVLVAGDALPDGVRAPDRAVGRPAIRWGVLDSAAAVLDSFLDLQPRTLLDEAARAAAAWYRRDCSDTADAERFGADGSVLDLSDPPDARDRVLIQVAGLGSTSDRSSIELLDTDRLRYDPESVVGFSYAGGCTPQPFGVGAAEMPAASLTAQLPQARYGWADTLGDIEVSARRLADLVEAAAAARPGATVDIAAHSLGGVVARRAVDVLVERRREDLLGVVATIGSPHRGADLATVAAAASAGLDGLDLASDDLEQLRNAPAVIQLSEVGRHAIGPPGPVPEGVRVVAIAGAADPVVPAASAIWEGGANVIVPALNPVDAHRDLPGADEVGHAILLARHGLPAACAGLASVMAGIAGSAVFGVGEDVLAAATGIVSWLI